MSPHRQNLLTRLLLLAPLSIFALALSTCAYRSVAMPGASHRGPLPALNGNQKTLARELEHDVVELAGNIGERRIGRGDTLDRARGYVETALVRAGYEPSRETFDVRGATVSNVIAELRGSSRAVVIVGAHYDSAHGAPGANDNASGVAVLLALARELRHEKLERPVRFIAFANEEPPFFQSDAMGSRVNAANLKARGVGVAAMLSLETLGYYTDAEDSQEYPFPLAAVFPSRGNFVAFVGNTDSRELVRTSITAFRESVTFPSEGGALPERTLGVAWSDHESYWRIGAPALMVTDTAMLRYPHYHQATDTPDKLDYERLARVTTGLVAVVKRLARSD